MLSTEGRPLPKCSLPCSKTGINTSDDVSWCVSKADQVTFVGAFPFQMEVRGALYIYYPECLARKRDLCRNVRSSNTGIIISDDGCWRVSTSDGSMRIQI